VEMVGVLPIEDSRPLFLSPGLHIQLSASTNQSGCHTSVIAEVIPPCRLWLLKRLPTPLFPPFRGRTPAHLRDKLRLEYSVKGHEVVIVERRPKWDTPKEWMESPATKLKFIRSASKWRLYWQRADLKCTSIRDSHRVTASAIWCANLMPILQPAFLGECKCEPARRSALSASGLQKILPTPLFSPA